MSVHVSKYDKELNELSKVNTSAAKEYLESFPGDLMCGLQLWYEGLGGHGVPNAAEMTALEHHLSTSPGWKDVGGVRYEKFGVQKSFKRV